MTFFLATLLAMLVTIPLLTCWPQRVISLCQETNAIFCENILLPRDYFLKQSILMTWSFKYSICLFELYLGSVPLLMICFVNNILKKKKKCFEMNKSWIFCENISIATSRLFPKQSVLMTSSFKFSKFSICHLTSISVGQSFIIVYFKSPFDLFLYTFMMKKYNMILEWTRHWSWSALVSAAFLVWLNLKTSFRISMGCQFVLMSSGEASYFELSINGKCLRNVAECCWYRVIK